MRGSYSGNTLAFQANAESSILLPRSIIKVSMFLFKKSKITVDCFIDRQVVFDLFKIDHAIKFIPDEFKALKPTWDLPVEPGNPKSKLTAPAATIKRCPGFSNLFNTGFIIPSWTDFGIEMFEDEKFNRHDPMNNLHMDSHPRPMLRNNLYKDYGHVKISSPWIIQEKSGINFSWNRCDWHNTERADKFQVMSGVVDFKAQHGSHINAFVKKGSVLQLKAGEPLVHVIPLTEKELELKCHVLSPAEYRKIWASYADRTMYTGQHRALLKAKEDSKCPFRF